MTASLRVLVVADVSPSVVRGGAERVLWEQASRLRDLGHRIRIVSRAPTQTTPDATEQEGISISHFPCDRRSALRLLRSSILEARHSVRRQLQLESCDLLHFYQPLSAYGVLLSSFTQQIPSLYSFLSPTPLEYVSRTGMTRHHRSGIPGFVARVILRHIEGVSLRRVTRIHVLSQYSADQLRQLYRIPADRLVMIPGGVDTERFQPAADRSEIRKALELPVSAPLLFTVRNLEARMGLDLLIQAVALLRQHVPEILLLIGGAGSLRSTLESLVASLELQDHVRFLGYIPDAALPMYYQAADAFVLPTRELEGFGLVTVEALACGTPVLGTAVGATPEILRPLDPSLVFRDLTPPAMADGLQRFLNASARDPQAGRRLREACRTYASTHYAWDLSIRRVEATISELVAGRTQGRTGATQRA